MTHPAVQARRHARAAARVPAGGFSRVPRRRGDYPRSGWDEAERAAGSEQPENLPQPGGQGLQHSGSWVKN